MTNGSAARCSNCRLSGAVRCAEQYGETLEDTLAGAKNSKTVRHDPAGVVQNILARMSVSPFCTGLPNRHHRLDVISSVEMNRGVLDVHRDCLGQELAEEAGGEMPISAIKPSSDHRPSQKGLRGIRTAELGEWTGWRESELAALGSILAQTGTLDG